MNTKINFYPAGKLTVDVDGEVHVEVNPTEILGNFTADHVAQHYSTGDLVDALDINEVIAHLSTMGYKVVDDESDIDDQ